MKNVFAGLLISLALWGCAKRSPDSPPHDGLRHDVSTNGLPFIVTVVETDETKTVSNLTVLAQNCFEKKNYARLDELASEYRSPDEEMPDGNWKLIGVYHGLSLSTKDPDRVWLERQKAIQEWIRARPNSITARVALARHLVSFAWKARGGGYADTVSEKAGKLFAQRLDEAAAVLDKAKDMQETCPVYWSTLMRIALGLGASKTQFNYIFEEALRTWPDYTGYYFERAVFLLPRWYGEAGEWEADLGKKTDLVGGKKGDVIYARVVWSIRWQTSEHHNIFEDSPGLSWERTDRGLQAIEQRFPDSLKAVNAHAHIAALAGDKEKTRVLMLKAGGKMALTEWSAKGEFIDCANWAFKQ